MSRIYEGEYGFKLTLLTNHDITGFSDITFRLKDPSGGISQHNGSAEDAAAGEIYFVPAEGDLSENGTYQLQATVDFTDRRLKSTVVTFRVNSEVA